ncbi:MAG: uracil-DNA glycosylase [Pigmentiphaga sp.]|nr:uracil-DNA glycosylase [Pigmentiphaga sp.]
MSLPLFPEASPSQLAEPVSAFLERLPAAWKSALGGVWRDPRWESLTARIEQRREAGAVIYPPDPFRVFSLLPPEQVKVVILGQDPYHGAGQAHGLSFSVPAGIARPRSLHNIFQEIAQEFGGDPKAFSNDLTRWVEQGVLLLNTSLTVEAGQAGSHAKWGWEVLTDAVVQVLVDGGQPLVFMLWGAHAQAKRPMLEGRPQILVLQSNHPSPLSARRPPVPFLGSGQFLKANEWLTQQGLTPIHW